MATLVQSPHSTDTNNVAAPIPAYQTMKAGWVLMDDVAGGSAAVQARDLASENNGGAYLLKFPNEDSNDYQFRVKHGIMSGRYRRVERLLSSMLIRNDPLIEDLPENMEEEILDLDLRGKNISRFTYQLAQTVIRYGHAGVLVSRERNSRPFWTIYKPERILGWRFGEARGERVLVQLRLEEHVQLPVGDYGVETVRQIRLLEPGKWEIWREQRQASQKTNLSFSLRYGLGYGDFEMVGSGRFPFAEIPFSVAYSDIGDSELVSSPPLRELAEASTNHYALSANRRQLLSLTAAPTLAVVGREIEQDATQKIGPSYMIQLHQGSSIQWLETSGVSFTALKEQIAEVERDIDTLGMASVVSQKMGAETAEAKRLDHVDGSTVMSVVSQNLEKTINACLRYHTMLNGQLNPPYPIASLDRDFSSVKLNPQEITSLLQVYSAGLVTRETLLSLLKDGYVLPSAFDIEKELKALDDSAAEAFMLSQDQEEEEEEEEEETQEEETEDETETDEEDEDEDEEDEDEEDQPRRRRRR